MLARIICGLTAFALASLLFSYGRFFRTVETAATEAGFVEQAA